MTEHVIVLTKACLFAIISHNFFILAWIGFNFLLWESGRLQMKFIKEILLLSHEVQKHSCFLNSFSEKSLGAATSSLSPDFVNGLKHYIYIIIIYICDLCTALSHGLHDGKSDIFL